MLLGITKIRLQQEETVLKMLPLTSMLTRQARKKWWGKILMPGWPGGRGGGGEQGGRQHRWGRRTWCHVNWNALKRDWATKSFYMGKNANGRRITSVSRTCHLGGILKYSSFLFMHFALTTLVISPSFVWDLKNTSKHLILKAWYNHNWVYTFSDKTDTLSWLGNTC